MLGNAFFKSDAVHKRTVSLGGQEHDLYFQRVSAYDMGRFAHHFNSADPNYKAEAACILVAASLCEADGKPVLTIEKARELTPEALTALFGPALEVNKREDVKGNE